MNDESTLPVWLGGLVLAALGVAGGVALVRSRGMKPRPPETPAPLPVPPPTPSPVPTPRPPSSGKITRSSLDSGGRTVRESPAELLAQARRTFPDLTLDEYTAARLVATEYPRGSSRELAAIIDSALNWAESRNLSLFDSLTRKAGGTYGRQGARPSRRAATVLDPTRVHVQAAISVLRTGALRGVSLGATHFFNPRAQKRLSTRTGGPCGPLVILERWSFGYPWKNRSRCELNRARPQGGPRAWVGLIPGVNALELMLFRPQKLGAIHTAAYQAARSLIQTQIERPVA